jgi:hypothetical protein
VPARRPRREFRQQWLDPLRAWPDKPRRAPDNLPPWAAQAAASRPRQWLGQRLQQLAQRLQRLAQQDQQPAQRLQRLVQPLQQPA